MMNDMDDLTRAVIDAWANPGPHPPTHRQAQQRLRQEWPALAAALDTLTDARQKGKAS